MIEKKELFISKIRVTDKHGNYPVNIFVFLIITSKLYNLYDVVLLPEYKYQIKIAHKTIEV